MATTALLSKKIRGAFGIFVGWANPSSDNDFPHAPAQGPEESADLLLVVWSSSRHTRYRPTVFNFCSPACHPIPKLHILPPFGPAIHECSTAAPSRAAHRCPLPFRKLPAGCPSRKRWQGAARGLEHWHTTIPIKVETDCPRARRRLEIAVRFLPTSAAALPLPQRPRPEP